MAVRAGHGGVCVVSVMSQPGVLCVSALSLVGILSVRVCTSLDLSFTCRDC